MVIFSHNDDFMKEPLDLVDDHIDRFIQTRRHRWDVGCLIFYGDPIYDIGGGSCAKRIQLEYPGKWSSLAYDSYAWRPDVDMIIDLFRPFEDDLSQHF
jgi:hypothetical protein